MTNLNFHLMRFILIILPIIGFSYRYTQENISKYFVELAFLCCSFFSIALMIFSPKFNYRKSPFILIAVLMLLSYTLKLIYIVLSDTEYYIFPLLVEIKPVVFIILSIIVIETSKKISLKQFSDFGFVFSIILLIDSIIRYFYFGTIRPGVLSESNYDGFIILICLCAGLNCNLYSQKKIAIMILATLVTMSKTGLICMMSILVYKSISQLRLKYILLFSVLAFPVLFVISERLSSVSEISSVDRLVMWTSFFNLLNDLSFWDILFGTNPGVPLKLYDNYLSWFIVNQSEQNGALGLHAFNYHSFYIRLFLSYGLILSFIFVFTFMRLSLNSRFLIMVFIVVLLQSFSLGTFYLSTVSVPLLIAYRGVDDKVYD
ncbi:hypothetical protein AADU56_002511 [Vibrio cholerae]|nr:hypothetical protein [Vibrio cholerae]EMC3731297.1 hypothetical protein [Vibrio cholerae]HDG1730345.1 hypothetical protein [Vibrio cholerae]HDL9431520.1 hypothetical protein [Vibrio cholerae]